MNVRTALISSALLLAVLGWACDQGPTSPSALGTPGGGSLGGVSLDSAGGAIVGVKPGACQANPPHPSCGGDKDPEPLFTLDLADDMLTTGIDVTLDRDTDRLLRFGNNSGLDITQPIEMAFSAPTLALALSGDSDCDVMAGGTGNPGETLTDTEWAGLLAELGSMQSWSIKVQIDKTRLGRPSDDHVVRAWRDGTFDGPGGRTSITLGGVYSHEVLTTATLIGVEDVWKFTGRVVVWAHGVGGGGKRSNRTIACGGGLDNTVTVTLHRSSA